MSQYARHNLQDTIIALATPPGVGAIGVIRVSGPDALLYVDQVFKGKSLLDQSSHTIHLGTIRKAAGQIVDEVLVSLFVAPTSYTGEHVVEISCHGSNFIIQEILEVLVERGARLAEPGEFTLRAFLNGKMDLSQAEAVSDLIASNSTASHALAMEQMRGGFSDQIKQLRSQLIDFASLIELELDFAEEDVEFANRDHLKKLVAQIQRMIKVLIDSFQMGNVMKQGVQTVIAGRPNAGKSTLLNALLNEERAIVSNIAGTTRDTIEENLNISGVQFRLVDTAGIREAADQIEAIGVEKTMEKIDQSSLLVYVFDVIQTQPKEVQEDLRKLHHSGQHVLLVANKMDLNPYTTFEHYFPDSDSTTTTPLSKSSWVPVSAINKMNIEYLKEKLYDAVVNEKVQADQTVVSNTRHFEALSHAYQSLTAVLDGLDSGITSDFIAMDIRQALHYLGLITGEVTTDDLLGNIFGKFCIGK